MRDVNPARIQQLLKSSHVPPFRPSHVRYRVVVSLLFVIRIVAAGSIRTGHPELEFLSVPIGVALKARGDGTNHDNPSLLSCYSACEVDWVGTRCCRGDDDRIRALAICEKLDLIGDLIVAS